MCTNLEATLSFRPQGKNRAEKVFSAEKEVRVTVTKLGLFQK